jgi:hypothetical protein
VKRKIVNAINQVLAKTCCALVPVRETQNSETSATNSYMESAEHKRALVNELGLIAKQFFEDQLPELSPVGWDYRKAVDDFFGSYNQRPFISNRGGQRVP